MAQLAVLAGYVILGSCMAFGRIGVVGSLVLLTALAVAQVKSER